MYNPIKPHNKKIIELVKSTWQTPYVSVNDGIVEKFFKYNEFHHVDGIGTKGVYYLKGRCFENAVIDALAMNFNDLAMNRATPYAVIDHLIVPSDDENSIIEIVNHLCNYCKKYNVAITGGETAIHNNIEGLELSISMLGFVKTPKQNILRKGDVLIGFKSNGLHCNGFTKIRSIYGEEFFPEFTDPTKIYLNEVLSLNDQFDISGMMHITGGAFTKLKSLIKNENIVIFKNHCLKPQDFFFEISDKIADDKKMYQTFNCGIGFVLGVPRGIVNFVLKQANEYKSFKADIIGEVIQGCGNVLIKSQFSNETVIL